MLSHVSGTPLYPLAMQVQLKLFSDASDNVFPIVNA